MSRPVGSKNKNKPRSQAAIERKKIVQWAKWGIVVPVGFDMANVTFNPNDLMAAERLNKWIAATHLANQQQAASQVVTQMEEQLHAAQQIVIQLTNRLQGARQQVAILEASSHNKEKHGQFAHANRQRDSTSPTVDRSTSTSTELPMEDDYLNDDEWLRSLHETIQPNPTPTGNPHASS